MTTTQRQLTAHGVRTTLWNMLNADIRCTGNRAMRWTEGDLVRRMSLHGAGNRQTVNALLRYCDHGDLVVSPGQNADGKFEPEYQINQAAQGWA